MKVFRKIGIAVAVSPGIDALLAEAHRYASAPGGDVELIHVGARTPEKEQSALAYRWHEREPCTCSYSGP